MSLNQRQQAVVDSTSKRLLCLAAAGSGKTHTMLARISQLVAQGNDPSSILVLTFTNAAASEMEGRYKASNQFKEQPEFRTFHGFCYNLICHDTDIMNHLGYYGNIPPRIPTDSQLRQVRVDVKLRCGTRLSDDQLDGKRALLPKERFDYDTFWRQYSKELRNRNYITFDIMCYEICSLFEEGHSLICKYKEKYKFIFIDEFQDTDPRQWRFANSFEDSSITVVGDPQQAIYQFRGADSSIIKKLAEDCNWDTIELPYNYRSTRQICNYANTIAKNPEDPYIIQMVSHVEGSPVKQFLYTECEELDLDLIASDISSGEQVAILARTNSEVDIIRAYISAAGFDHKSNKINSYNRDLLLATLDLDVELAFLKSLLVSADYNNYTRATVVDPSLNTLEAFLEQYGDRRIVLSSVRRIDSIREVLISDSIPFHKCTAIAALMGCSPKGINTPAYSNVDIVNYMSSFLSEAPTGDVYVGTIHSVKGQEFDVVHVVNVDSYSFKLNSEEHRNLFYVACTRAKKQLYVYFADDEEDEDKEKEHNPYY